MVVFTKVLSDKNWNLGGIHIMQKKKSNHLLPRLGSRGSARASAPHLGSSLGISWFQFILFLHFMKPPKFQFFCQHFRETCKNSRKNAWNQFTRKKMNGFLVKPHIYCPNITETVIKKNERFTFKTMVKNNIETSWAIGRALGQDRFLYCNYSLLF